MLRIYPMFVVSIVLLYDFGECFHAWKFHPMRLVDRMSAGTPSRPDLFFDRMVSIVLDIDNFIGDGRLFKPVATGVFIDDERVLTSYNPFRNLTRGKAELLEKIYVCIVMTRRVIEGHRTFYDTQCYHIVCGRPLIPMDKSEYEEEQWHGPDKKHSPLHDLMVLRIDTKMTMFDPPIQEEFYEIRHTSEMIKNGTISRKAGPILTKLAKADDIFKKPIKYAALGLTQKEVQMYYSLYSVESQETDETVVNCDEWLPRSWGYFICTKYDDKKYFGFGSGAMIFSQRLLFGVGSFTLTRGNDSITVFTDVRPYLEHIAHTCTSDDLYLGKS